MTYIIVSAVKFEVAPLLEALERKGIKTEYQACGIGAINAARSSRELGKTCEGKDVIYVGTCGSLGSFNGPELVRISKTVWLPPCERSGIAWSIENIDPPFELPPPPPWAKSLPEKIALCSPTIAKSSQIDPETSEKYGFTNQESLVENLELYSCAADIANSAKSFVAIMAITNLVCMDGRSEWRQYFKQAALMTAEFVSARI